MRYQGRITSWNDDKGFGFVTPNGGGERVFVHIKAFARADRRPTGNELVTYELKFDDRKRGRHRPARSRPSPARQKNSAATEGPAARRCAPARRRPGSSTTVRGQRWTATGTAYLARTSSAGEVRPSIPPATGYVGRRSTESRRPDTARLGCATAVDLQRTNCVGGAPGPLTRELSAGYLADPLRRGTTRCWSCARPAASWSRWSRS
jgi:cold shock CspA family protein